MQPNEGTGRRYLHTRTCREYRQFRLEEVDFLVDELTSRRVDELFAVIVVGVLLSGVTLSTNATNSSNRNSVSTGPEHASG